DNGIPESASGHHRRRWQLGQQGKADLLSATQREQVENRKQRKQGGQGQRCSQATQQQIQQRTRLPQRARQLEQVDRIGVSERRARLHHRTPRSPASARCRISAPTMLTSNVIASRTSAAYIKAPTSTAPASGK